MIDDRDYEPEEPLSVTLADGRTFLGEFMNVDWAQDNESRVDELCIAYDTDGTYRSFREDEIASFERLVGRPSNPWELPIRRPTS